MWGLGITCVDTTLDTATDPAASADPPLKPNHPIHSRASQREKCGVIQREEWGVIQREEWGVIQKRGVGCQQTSEFQG